MQLFVDYLPILVFFGTYVATKNIYMAVTAIMVVAPIVLAVQWYLTRKLNKMTAISTALVVGFGGLTLILDNPVFIYWKPTAFYWAFAIACMGSHFIGERTIVQRMMQAASKGGDSPLELLPTQWRTLNLMWVAFATVAGALNIYVAYQYSEPTWVKFKLFGLLGLTLIFLIVQAAWIASTVQRKPGPDTDT